MGHFVSIYCRYFEGGVRVPALVYAPGLLPAAAAGTTYEPPTTIEPGGALWSISPPRGSL